MIKKKAVTGKGFLAQARGPSPTNNITLSRKSSDLYERLHKDSEYIKNEKERMKKEREEELVKECTFAPQTNKRYRSPRPVAGPGLMSNSPV